MEISILDRGMAVIAKVFGLIMGFFCIPLLFAAWELYFVFFLYLGPLALLVRALFPGSAPRINRAFNKSWDLIKRLTVGYIKLFLGF